MSFNYNFTEAQLEQYINNTVHGKSFPQKAKLLLLSLINGEDHLEHVRDWMEEYTQEGSTSDE